MKDKLIEEINSLSQEKMTKVQEFIETLSTDHSHHNSNENSFEKDIVAQDYFKPLDKYGNCQLSLAMEEKKFQGIKDAFNLKNLSDTEMLKEFAFKMCNETYRDELNITHEVAVSVFGEVNHQLELIGENTTDIIEAYNLA
jgi:hypothetical protein